MKCHFCQISTFQNKRGVSICQFCNVYYETFLNLFEDREDGLKITFAFLDFDNNINVIPPQFNEDGFLNNLRYAKYDIEDNIFCFIDDKINFFQKIENVFISSPNDMINLSRRIYNGRLFL